MTDPLPDLQDLERARALQRKRSEVLALPPEQAVERILSDPQPAALVHSFPESDFYFLVHDIGPEDALPLLALASDKQWDHVVDLESWAKDRIEVHGVTRWLNLLLEADPRRFVRWFLKDRLNFVEFYLFHNMEVRVREHDQDPSEFGEGFFTLDQVYYVRFLKMPPAPGDSAIDEEARKGFLMKFLQRLAEHDHLVFQDVLLEATHVIPAETEEEEYRWRKARLEDKGFVTLDEAIGIYQAIQPADLQAQRPKSIPRAAEVPSSALPVPAYPLREIGEDTHFSRALARVGSDHVLTHIQWEFANLCNQIIVADHKRIRDREQLRRIVAKACGYMSIGLERLKGDEKKEVDPGASAAVLARYPLTALFRLGFGAGLEIKWQAERWLSSSWFAKAGLRLTFWGEQWMGVLGGLLLKKPLFYDNYRTGMLYREFASVADVESTGHILRQVQAVDRLLTRMNIELQPPEEYRFLTWKNVLLTLWARHRLGLKEAKLLPLELRSFTRFFSALLPGDPLPDTVGPRRVPDSMKTAFIEFLAHDTGLKDYEISEKLGGIFEDLFAEIEAEYGRVAARNLDPRFVQLFLVKTA
jgi:hypothetical protein